MEPQESQHLAGAGAQKVAPCIHPLMPLSPRRLEKRSRQLPPRTTCERKGRGGRSEWRSERAKASRRGAGNRGAESLAAEGPAAEDLAEEGPAAEGPAADLVEDRVAGDRVGEDGASELPEARWAEGADGAGLAAAASEVRRAGGPGFLEAAGVHARGRKGREILCRGRPGGGCSLGL